MIHRVKIKDYILLHGEGHAYIAIDSVDFHVFIPFGNLYSRLLQKNYREMNIDVNISVLPSYLRKVYIKRKMSIELTEKNALAPDYLFIGEVVEKKDEKKCGRVIFDCGILLDVCIDKGYTFKELKKGDYILVIGRLDMLGVDDIK